MQNVMQALYLTRNARGLPASVRRYSEKAREEKKKCDREIISLEEFQQWLRDSKI